MREHPDGGGVEEYLGVRKRGEVGVTVLARAADHADGRRAFPRREGAGGMRSPAAAEDDHAFACEGDPRRVQREPHAVEVGVIADQPAAAVYHGVDRAALPRGGVHLVEEGDDRPLVGDGDIHAVELFCREKARERAFGELEKGVTLPAHTLVQERGVAVPERTADEPVSHCVTSA